MKMTLAMWIMVLATAIFHPSMVFGGEIGVVYGRKGDNLPSPKQVINFLTKDLNYKVPLISVPNVTLEILEALSGTNLTVTIGVPNDAIAQVASSQKFADKWFQDYVITYIHKGVRFRYLCVGTEAIPGALQSFVQQAMWNLQESARKAGISNVHVTTSVEFRVLGRSYPPSTGQFAIGVDQIMNNITRFLYGIGSPLLVNACPYDVLSLDPKHITLESALFRSKTPAFKDNNLEYYNYFDAMVDAYVAAMARVVKKEDVKVVVAASGWPTAGARYARLEYAQEFNQKLKKHVLTNGRTPRRPDINLEVYIYELFNENLKRRLDSRYFGTLYPNFTEIYPLWH